MQFFCKNILSIQNKVLTLQRQIKKSIYKPFKKIQGMGYINNIKDLICAEVKTKYYINFVCEYDNEGNVVTYYHQLTRTNDDAILYANNDINCIYAFCFHEGIDRYNVTNL